MPKKNRDLRRTLEKSHARKSQNNGSMSLKDIKLLAKERKIHNYSSKNKTDLIDAIIENLSEASSSSATPEEVIAVFSNREQKSSAARKIQRMTQKFIHNRRLKTKKNKEKMFGFMKIS